MTTRQRACHLLRQHEIDCNCPLFRLAVDSRLRVFDFEQSFDAKDLARLQSTCTFFGDEKEEGDDDRGSGAREGGRGLTTDGHAGTFLVSD